MLEQAIDTNSKAFNTRVGGLPELLETRVNSLPMFLKSRVDGLLVFLESCVDSPPLDLKASIDIGANLLESCVDSPLLVVKASIDIAGNRLESGVDGLLVFLKASVKIRTKLIESRVDSLPKFLRSSICVVTTLLKAFVNQPMGAVKSGLDSPKGSLFSILSLLEERVDVGCEFLELLVDISPERIDIRSKRSNIRLRCRVGLQGGRVRHRFLRGRGLRRAGSGDEDQWFGDRPRLRDCTHEHLRVSAPGV